MISKYLFRDSSNNPLFEKSRDEFSSISTELSNMIYGISFNKYSSSIPFTQLESTIIRLDYIVESIDYPAGRTDFLEDTKDNTLSDIADARITKLRSWTSIMKHITNKFKKSIEYSRLQPFNYNTSPNIYRIENIFGDDIVYERQLKILSPELRLLYEKEHKNEFKMLGQQFFNRYCILSNIISNIIKLPFDENAPQFSLLNSNIIKLYLGVNRVGYPTSHYNRYLRKVCDDKLTDLCIKNIHTWNDNIDNVLLEYKQSNNLLDEITRKQLLQHDYFNKSTFDKHNFKQIRKN